MKGSLEGVLPMIGILLMAIVLSMQSIPLAEVMNDAVSDSTSDIETVVNTRAYADFYFYNFVPLAAEYAWNEVSYELGKNGGGQTWTKSWLVDYETNMQTLEENANDYAGGNLSATVTGSEGVCDIPNSDYEISVFLLKTPEDFKDLDDEEAKLYVSHDTSSGNPFSFNPEPIETTCNFGGESYYQDDSLFYSTETNATDNRYIQLADRSLVYFLKLKSELSDVSEQNGYSSWSCSKPSASDKATATRNALNPIETNIEEAMKKAAEEVEPLPDGMVNESSIISTDTFTYGNTVNTDKLEASVQGTTQTDANECGPSREQPEYRAKATMTPDRIEVDWEIKDEKYQVIVEDTYENLEFKVDPYLHKFQ